MKDDKNEKKSGKTVRINLSSYENLPDLYHQYRVRNFAQLFNLLEKNQITDEMRKREERDKSLVSAGDELVREAAIKIHQMERQVSAMKDILSLFVPPEGITLSESDFEPEHIRRDFFYRVTQEFKINVVPAETDRGKLKMWI